MTALHDGAGGVGPEVPRKACPVCGTASPVFELTCPVCGYSQFPQLARGGPRHPARKLWIALAVAIAGLLLSFCVLYLAVLSVRR
ncbi:MAG: hypothetical protein WBS54_05950 [Acidobacteriota bacterium]